MAERYFDGSLVMALCVIKLYSVTQTIAFNNISVNYLYAFCSLTESLERVYLYVSVCSRGPFFYNEGASLPTWYLMQV